MMDTTAAPPPVTDQSAPIGDPGPPAYDRGYGGRGMGKYHPALFTLITVIALALIALTCWQHHQQGIAPLGTSWIRSRLDFLIFLSCWTALFGAIFVALGHTGRCGMCASHATHVFWLFLTWSMWLIGAALFSSRLNQVGCGRTPAIEGLSWAEFALCFIIMWVIIFRIGGKMESLTLLDGETGNVRRPANFSKWFIFAAYKHDIKFSYSSADSSFSINASTASVHREILQEPAELIWPGWNME
ncbi:hypothetical protein M407DRAFT_4163 [Tulasnella calospora MUT 4182]|uniref:MARVEL domain-containing protein n=1 Tax=Tulasnella calospora MUT 4182 TaxID=1051891 RepID=A0A0C3QWF6_9AGAM|nr:hypothetical protein M407DRAFT_4163 [Tulasnella calospora MUT 4182]